MQANTTGSPFVLSTAEMAFMLTLLEVPHLIGGDNAALFPTEPAAREALLAAGKQQLEASGKLAWQPDLLSYHPDDVMVALLVPLAFPRVVITCVSQTHPDRWQGVSYSMVDSLVVEMVIIDGQYHLGAFATLDEIMPRLAEAFHLPATAHAGPDIVIPNPTFEAVRKTGVAADALPLPSDDSARLRQALHESVQDVMFLVFHVQQTEIVATRPLGMIIDPQGDAWLVTPQEPDHMHVRPTSGPAVGQTLLALVADVQTEAS